MNNIKFEQRRPKQRIHTTLTSEAYKVIEKYKDENRNINTILEKALISFDQNKFKARIGLKHFDSVIKRVNSGIDGFDDLVEGGIPESFIVILTGPPGTGKSTFAMQFLKQAVEQKQRTIYFSTDETGEQLARHCLRFGWNIQDYIEKNLMELFALPSLNLEEIYDIITNLQPARIVIDSLNLYNNTLELRKSAAWHNLLKLIKEKNITCMMVTEKDHGLEKKKFDGFDFMGDGVIFMDKFTTKETNEFVLVVKKMRATNIDDTAKVFKFTANGIIVTDISPFINN